MPHAGYAGVYYVLIPIPVHALTTQFCNIEISRLHCTTVFYISTTMPLPNHTRGTPAPNVNSTTVTEVIQSIGEVGFL